MVLNQGYLSLRKDTVYETEFGAEILTAERLINTCINSDSLLFSAPQNSIPDHFPAANSSKYICAFTWTILIMVAILKLRWLVLLN